MEKLLTWKHRPDDSFASINIDEKKKIFFFYLESAQGLVKVKISNVNGQTVGQLLTSSLTRGMGLFLRNSGMLSMPNGVLSLCKTEQ